MNPAPTAGAPSPATKAPNQPKPAAPQKLPDTRERLLEAAGEVFARVGYRRATVREICTRAHANVAAINYHFRDKDSLYLEVLRYAHRCALEAHSIVLSRDDAPAIEQFRALVRAILSRIFDEGRPAWQGKLMAWEMVDPSPALDTFIAESIRPLVDNHRAILRRILGPDAEEGMVRRCWASVMGQCLFYRHSREIIRRLDPQQAHTPGTLDEIATHITEFSLAGLESLAKNLSQQRSA